MKAHADTQEDDQQIQSLPPAVAVLPVNDIVPLPGIMMSLVLTRQVSILAAEFAIRETGLLALVLQKDLQQEEPGPEDVHTVGTLSRVARVLEMVDGSRKVVFQGLRPVQLRKLDDQNGCIVAVPEEFPSGEVDEESGPAAVALVEEARELVQFLVQREQLSEELLFVLDEVQDPTPLSFLLLAQVRTSLHDVQKALEDPDPLQRLERAVQLLRGSVERFRLWERLNTETQEQLQKSQQEFYLREQLKIIQRELGEEDGTEDERELVELKKRLEKAKLPKQAAQEAFRQLARLERMAQESSEYALLRTYLDWVADLPWGQRSRDRLDLKVAERTLTAEHYGLLDVKERILEYLSVRKLKKDIRGPILCFVGPPGVGKTSLGRSIASALNRKFFRISLGGLRDEAEIRGHRRTYVGALPGRILQGLKQVGTKNPVFLLDELDKVGADFRGDPASALLEVLDPEQNRSFRDHYLELEFDLSEILFIGTANTVDTIPEALLDRLEVIYIPGYTTDEKLHILRQYLIPRQLDENGLGEVDLVFQEKALLFVIERYTREAGVRGLERQLGRVCRKLAREYAETGRTRKVITRPLVRKLLGNTHYDPDTQERNDLVGFVHGLAWTVHGGEVMPVEASVAPGSGKLTLTGQLGTVMQESAQAALFFARAHAEELGLTPGFHKELDVHVHVPGGATPKDGPSAGITICTAVLSALSNRRISHEVAMTGEITLRGSVLPVGGIKEKVLAAVRYGVTKVILPRRNVKDLEEVAKEQREKVEFVPVDHISEVLKVALEPRH